MRCLDDDRTNMNAAMKKPGHTLFVLLLVIAGPALAQENRSYILEHTNVAELQRLSDQWSREYEVKHAEALRMARERGWRTDGLQYIDDLGRPVYFGSDNFVAATITQTTLLRTTYGVHGSGMLIGEWDGGHPRLTHQDLSGRVTIGDTPYSEDSHATHVAGTLIVSPPVGWTDLSMGMAPAAQAKCYDWDNDNAEMSGEAASLLISNHSYGVIGGWDYEGNSACGGNKWTWYGGTSQFIPGGDDPSFGMYDAKAHAWDEICRLAPFYLPVKAAGNDNTNDPEVGIDCVRNGVGGSFVTYQTSVHPGGDGSQQRNLTTNANAKNILTVANLQSDLTINSSSSRGGTDDGRIKPDICGMGTDVWSAESGADDAYGVKTGTSMASPNVAGSLLLLQELYESMHGGSGIYMRSASLKGLAIHNAQDLGLPGPDFTHGWGLLRAQLMGNTIARDVGSGGTQTERILEIPGTLGHVYTFNTTGDLRVTLCYTDREGTATSTHNNPAPKLVNDLDLRVIGPGGTVYTPYVMTNTLGVWYATTGDNDLDNVEQVYRTGLPAGTYQVHVNAEGSLTGTQPYSLIISGQKNSCNYSVSHGPIELTSTTYNAQNDITSEGDVAAGGSVTYNAGGSVSLRPGFSAPAGSSFIARIQTCN